ncbi:MAG: VWA domain-containing protein [Acidobacteria bacterium]|nr:VWA domain-containing protein [Acidobacteriota bacterium]
MFILACFVCGYQNDDLVVNERFRVEYVVLDVLATTRKGELVTDLTAEDFEVVENRKQVKIESFDVLDLRGDVLSREPEISEDEEIPKQTVPQVIVAMDIDDAEHLDVKMAFGQVREFLVALGDQKVSLNLYSLQNGAITKGFVTDANRALEQFDEYVYRAEDRNYDRQSRSATSSSRQVGGPYGNLSTLIPGPKSLADIEEAFERCTRFGEGRAVACIMETLGQVMDEQELRALRVINQIESLLYHFQDTEGLKIMYLVSPGFSVDTPMAPQQLAQIYLNRVHRVNDDVTRPGTVMAGYSVRDEYERVVHAFVRNRVIFHTLDIFNTGIARSRSFSAEYASSAGSQMEQTYQTYEHDMGSGLGKLADDSGGSFHQLSNLAEFTAESVSQNRFFYVIGYTSPSTKPGKFRKIKIKCKRKGVELQHRKGYVGAS